MSLNEWIRLAPKPRELTNGDEWNVFLSYRSVNRTWVLNLYDVLREQGHKVFLDQCVLTLGDSLVRGLEGALSKSQAGILVWSNAASDSDWVRREYEVMEQLASEKSGFQFIPIKLDNSTLPIFAKRRIFLDFSSYPDGPNGGELLRLLHAVTGVPLSDEVVHFAEQQDELSQDALAEIGASIMISDPESLIDLFHRGGVPWQTSSMLGCKAAEGLISLKCYQEAVEILKILKERFPKAVRPQQLMALTLARRGENDDLKEAQLILAKLYNKGENDPETLGIYARTWMDRYNKEKNLDYLKQSRDLYAEAFEIAQDDYYTGINAAAKSVMLGDEENVKRGAEIAEKVEKIVGTNPHPKDYWKTATVAEVFLIQKKYAEAAKLYEAAISMARMQVGHQESTWKQACLLLDKLQPSGEERQLIRQVFAALPDCV